MVGSWGKRSGKLATFLVGSIISQLAGEMQHCQTLHVAADHLSLSFVIHDVLLAVLLSCKFRHCPKELLVNPSYGQLQPYLQLGGPNIAMQPTQQVTIGLMGSSKPQWQCTDIHVVLITKERNSKSTWRLGFFRCLFFSCHHLIAVVFSAGLLK